jgi:HAMP domain-containing protein
MEILIFAVALLVAAFALVAWLRLSDDLRERDEWQRFQQAMADAQDPKEEN